jgi:site-specific DNA-cytosine methylase
VDQIHDFAANRHREFVIKHLEPWLEHAEERELELLEESIELQPNRFSDGLADPAWLKIKKASKLARSTKAANTRSQNRLRVQEKARNRHSKTLQKGKTVEDLRTTQRTRSSRSNKSDDPQPKRPRGRPRKCQP